jgi:hypothetical protein
MAELGLSNNFNTAAGLAGGSFFSTPTVTTPTVKGLSLNPVRVTNQDGTWGMNFFGGNTTTPTAPQTNSGFGLNTETLGTVFSGLNALSGLANAYLGFKNYSLAKKQFGFEKAAINRNIANQAKIINNTYDNAAQVAAGMIGGRDSAGNYGMTNQEVVDRYAANAEKKHVDGSKVG